MVRVRRDRRAEAGDTLIELLIAIAVLSFGVMGVYSMLTSTVTASHRIKGRSEVSQVLTKVSDAIARAEWQCASPARDTYRDVLAGVRPSASWTVAVESVSHWGRSRAFEDGCPADDDPAVFKTLKLRVVVQAPADRGRQTLEYVKRP